jgi:glucokinase
MDKPTVIAIDLGGTAIKLGRFDIHGTCLESITVPTPQPSLPDPVIQAMVEAIALLRHDQNCIAIAIGCPGPADAQGRIAKFAINLDSWHNIPLANTIEKATALPTIIENDANCAGLGEVWLGAGRSFQNLILLTLGTGVGGAIFIQGELWTGSYGAAGELGLITLDRDGPTCRSGNRGSLEQFASIGGIYRRTGQDPAILGELAAQGDRQALNFWEDYGRGLGAGLASLLYVLTPEAVIFGGGISSSAQFFLPAVEAEIKQRVLPTSREGLQLLSAELGNRAGMAGAARLAWQQIGINKLRINEKEGGIC